MRSEVFALETTITPLESIVRYVSVLHVRSQKWTQRSSRWQSSRLDHDTRDALKAMVGAADWGDV